MPDLAPVASGYAHYAKQAVPMGLVQLEATELKVYHVERPGEPVPEAVAKAARGLLLREAEGRLGLADDLGFVILHRCGADFHFLLVTVWRGSNEGWEAVWYHQGGMAGFEPFEPAYPPQAGAPRPTFCVWELGVVAHEAKAWSRFLASERDASDLEHWREDWFSGEV